MAGGQEIPNDLTLFVTDDRDRLLPLVCSDGCVANRRPVPVADHAPLADCSAIAFDASRSADPEGDELRYRWEFGDGTGADEVAVVHRYPGPGSYDGVAARPRWLAPGWQRRGHAIPGDGQATADGAGRRRRRRGTGCNRRLRRQQLRRRRPSDRRLCLGLPGRQPRRRPDPYPCVRAIRPLRRDPHRSRRPAPAFADSSTDQIVVAVNAAPVAVPGNQQHAATGEAVRLDGSRSYDVDGKITSWNWDLGDGAKATGPTIEHTYTAPGTYTVTLTVADDAGLANSTRQQHDAGRCQRSSDGGGRRQSLGSGRRAAGVRRHGVDGSRREARPLRLGLRQR